MFVCVMLVFLTQVASWHQVSAAKDDQPAPVDDFVVSRPEVVATQAVEDHVDAVLSTLLQGFSQLSIEVGGAGANNDLVGLQTELGDQKVRLVLRADGTQDNSPLLLEELNGQDPDTSSGAVHQHCLAGLDISQLKEAVISRDNLHWVPVFEKKKENFEIKVGKDTRRKGKFLRASLLVGPLGRNVPDVANFRDEVCGEGSEAADPEHAVADLEVPRVSSNLLNLTGILKTWHELSLGSRLIKAKNREHLKRKK